MTKDEFREFIAARKRQCEALLAYAASPETLAKLDAQLPRVAQHDPLLARLLEDCNTTRRRQLRAILDYIASRTEGR